MNSINVLRFKKLRNQKNKKIKIIRLQSKLVFFCFQKIWLLVGVWCEGNELVWSWWVNKIRKRVGSREVVNKSLRVSVRIRVLDAIDFCGLFYILVFILNKLLIIFITCVQLALRVRCLCTCTSIILLLIEAFGRKTGQELKNYSLLLSVVGSVWNFSRASVFVDNVIKNYWYQVESCVRIIVITSNIPAVKKSSMRSKNKKYEMQFFLNYVLKMTKYFLTLKTFVVWLLHITITAGE